MRKDFYIFRHGETDENLAGRWQGCGVDFSAKFNRFISGKNIS